MLKIFKKEKGKEGNSLLKNNTVKNWKEDMYKTTEMQKKLLLILLFVSFLVTVFSLLTIRYLKNSQKVVPFVIEIDKKSGVPTVVQPVTIKTLL